MWLGEKYKAVVLHPQPKNYVMICIMQFNQILAIFFQNDLNVLYLYICWFFLS